MNNGLTFILRFAAFVAIHSFLAVPSVKESVIRRAGLNPSAYRLVYNMISLLVFGWVMAANRHSYILYEVPGVARYVFYLMQAMLLAALASCLVNTGLITFLGLDALAPEAGKRPPALITKGWYGIVRHPLYFLSMLFMFLNPVMTVRWMTLACLGSLYFVVGALIEEKRLSEGFGEEYLRYRQAVPFLVPSRGTIISSIRGVRAIQTTIFLFLFLLAGTAFFPDYTYADLSLPVNGPITSGVGLRVDPFGSGKLIYHRGIDIAVPVGTPVQAVRKGQVVFAGERRGYGATVIIEHDNGDRTMYGHNSLVRVASGDLVEPGMVVAFSGSSGRSTGPHVHFEVMQSGQPVMEQDGREDPRLRQAMDNSRQRDQYELQMDDAISSVFRTIGRSASTGQGGQ